jgi:hypothetical protein
VRVALSEQDVASGWMDRLLDAVLPAGAEDFDQVPGARESVEVEVRLRPLSRRDESATAIRGSILRLINLNEY